MQVWMPLLVFLLMGIQESHAQTGVDPVTKDDAAVVAFVNVAVVTMQDNSVLSDQTVVIREGLIEVIGSANTIAVPADAMVIDGTGRYLIPGLADMHVHIRIPFEDGPLYLNAGITTVLSMGTRFPDLDAFLRERDRSRTAAIPVPTLYSTGPHIRGGESPDEVERIVRVSAEGGFDFVKVHGDVSPEAFDCLQDTAKSLDIRVTGHAQRKQACKQGQQRQRYWQALCLDIVHRVNTHERTKAHIDRVTKAEHARLPQQHIVRQCKNDGDCHLVHDGDGRIGGKDMWQKHQKQDDPCPWQHSQ